MIKIHCDNCGKMLFEGTQKEANRIIIYCDKCEINSQIQNMNYGDIIEIEGITLQRIEEQNGIK